jgi:hypothetical protein
MLSQAIAIGKHGVTSHAASSLHSARAFSHLPLTIHAATAAETAPDQQPPHMLLVSHVSSLRDHHQTVSHAITLFHLISLPAGPASDDDQPRSCRGPHGTPARVSVTATLPSLASYPTRVRNELSVRHDTINTSTHDLVAPFFMLTC